MPINPDPSAMTANVYHADDADFYSRITGSATPDWRKIKLGDIITNKPHPEQWLAEQSHEWLVEQLAQILVDYEKLFWKHCEETAHIKNLQNHQTQMQQAMIAQQARMGKSAAQQAMINTYQNQGYNVATPKANAGIYPLEDEDIKDRSPDLKAEERKSLLHRALKALSKP